TLRMLRLLTSSLLVALSTGSFCGDSTVPYSIQVRKDGQPVLGCARPMCFGWAPSGKPATNTGSFFRINGHHDGFLRRGPDSIPPYGPDDARFHRPQTSVCDPAYTSAQCAGAANQWVGGIAPVTNVTTFATALQCCTYIGLQQSQDRGRASIHAGQIALGGEVLDEKGNQLGFDYISNIAKTVHMNGTVQYDVSVRRMLCEKFPEPAENEKKDPKKTAKKP
ncbi:hypothetical protein PENTCL1PPCAC_14226, partial [Pristionchus entomophagus]